MNKPTVPIRKSVYALTETETLNLRQAFERLYQTRKYQEKAAILTTDGHYQRNDLLFLPWARAYFANFEKALQAATPMAHPVVTLPYWDYTSKKAIEEGIPPLLADPYYESTETDANGAEAVVTKPNPLYMAEYEIPLRTFRNENPNQTLLETAHVSAQKAMKAKDFVTFGTEIYVADIQSHLYLGGSSANTQCTSYDPIFWFTHCQLDHFWYEWQQQQPDLGASSMPESVLNASLKPFTQGDEGTALKGKDVLDTENLDYTYLR